MVCWLLQKTSEISQEHAQEGNWSSAPNRRNGERFSRVEALINSKPLPYVYNDIGEPELITPASLLVRKLLTSLPTT